MADATEQSRGMRLRLVPFLVIAGLTIAACGSDSDSSSGGSGTTLDATSAATDAAATTAADESTGDGDTEDTAAPATEAPGDDGDQPAAPPAGDVNATLTLANGESYEFSVLCSLEPQIAAGSEILFTATSYDDPSLDITQFGDEGQVTGLATVSVYDATTYDSLWEASSIYDALGGTIELSLNGSTITGVGAFFPAGDIDADPVDGEVVANC